MTTNNLSELSPWARELRYLDQTAASGPEVFFGPRAPALLPEPVTPVVAAGGSAATADVRITVPAGAKLGLIAHEFYSDARLWWVIADASDIIDPFDIAAGTELRIPDLSRVQAEVLR